MNLGCNKNLRMMKKRTFYIVTVLAMFVAVACSKKPFDDEGRLITTRNDSYITFFDLLGPDNRTVLVANSAVIDTAAGTVTAVAKFGTNMKHLKPYSSLAIDAIIQPAMGEWVDFSQPRKYTVISGSRKVKKEYTFTISLQGQ